MKSLTKILLAVALSTSAGYAVANTNPITEARAFDVQDRNVKGYNAVSLMGSYDVYITQGSTESVKVEAPKDVIDRIITEVEGGVLKIYTKKNDNFNWGDWFNGDKKIVIYVVAKDLNSISVTGSGDIFFKEGITTNSLKLRVTGSGDIAGKVNVKNLESSVSGSGDIKVNGRADNSSVSVVGSGDFTAPALTTNITKVRVAGSGDARVNASQQIDASVAGSGDVHYTGGAKLVHSSTSGSGDISRF